MNLKVNKLSVDGSFHNFDETIFSEKFIVIGKSGLLEIADYSLVQTNKKKQ